MDDWSDSDVEGVRDATPKSNGRYSQDLFSERISQFSDLDDDFSQTVSTPTAKDVCVTKANSVGVGLTGSELNASGVNTSWLLSPSSQKSGHKTQRSGSRSSKRTKNSKVSGKQAAAVTAVEKSDAVTWSQDFPEDPCSANHDSLATLSPDYTQRPPSLPKFSFLKNSSVDSSLSSPPPSAAVSAKNKSATKRLGRFSYPKGKLATSINSSDSQLDLNLEVMRPPGTPAGAADRTVKKENLSKLKSVGSDSESQLSVVVDLLQPGHSSINDETMMTTTSMNTATSDATAYQPSAQQTRPKHQGVEDSQSLGSMDISMKDKSAVHMPGGSVIPASYDDDALLELSPSFRALAEELDDPDVRPSETEIQQIEQELDQMAEELPGMSGWSSLPDLSSQGELVGRDEHVSADNNGMEESAPVVESADVVYGTIEDSVISSGKSLPKSQQKKRSRKKPAADHSSESSKQKSSKYSVPDLSDEERQASNVKKKLLLEPKRANRRNGDKLPQRSKSSERKISADKNVLCSPKDQESSIKPSEKKRSGSQSKSIKRKSAIRSQEHSTVQPVQFTSSLSRKAARPRTSGSLASSTTSGNTLSSTSSDLPDLDSKSLSANIKSMECAKDPPHVSSLLPLADLDASIDLTVSDEDELAGVICRRDNSACMPDVDLTKSDEENSFGSKAEDVPSGSEECPSIQSVQKAPSVASSNVVSLESVIMKRSRRSNVIESDAESESGNENAIASPGDSFKSSDADDSSAEPLDVTRRKFSFKSKVNLGENNKKNNNSKSVSSELKESKRSSSDLHTSKIDKQSVAGKNSRSAVNKSGAKRHSLPSPQSVGFPSEHEKKVLSKAELSTPTNSPVVPDSPMASSMDETPARGRKSTQNISLPDSQSTPLRVAESEVKRSFKSSVKKNARRRHENERPYLENKTITVCATEKEQVSAAVTPRRSQRVKSSNQNSSFNSSKLSDIINTPDKRQELDMLLKTALSPLKDLPTNLPSPLAQSLSKSKRKHHQYSHERLVIDDVTLPPSQVNPAEQVQSLLEFLEDTAAALQPPQAPLLPAKSAKSVPGITSSVKKISKIEPTPKNKSSSKKSNSLELSKSLGRSPTTRSCSAKRLADVYDANGDEQGIQTEDTMLDRSSFLGLMGKSPQRGSKSEVGVDNSSTSPAKPEAHATEEASLGAARKSPASTSKKQSRASLKRKSAEECGEDSSKMKKLALQSEYGLKERPNENVGVPNKKVAGRKKATKKVVEEDSLASDADGHVSGDQSDPLDDSHHSAKKSKPQKKEPIWLAKYSVPRNRHHKNADEQEDNVAVPTKAEAVCNLFAKSYSGKRYHKEGHLPTETSTSSAAELDSVPSTSAVKDTSVFDFVPSQPSPVKTKKRGKTSTGAKFTRQTEAKNITKPRKNTKKALALKQQLIQQINHDWGIEAGSGEGRVAAHEADDCPEPPMSQATALRNHINDIDTSVRLAVEEEAPKKHCRFRTSSSNRGVRPKDEIRSTEECEGKSLRQTNSEPPECSIPAADSSKIAIKSRSHPQQVVNEEMSASTNAVGRENVPSALQKQKTKLLSDFKGENPVDIQVSRGFQQDGCKQTRSPSDIKIEIGADETSPSTVRVQPKASARVDETLKVPSSSPPCSVAVKDGDDEETSIADDTRSRLRTRKSKVKKGVPACSNEDMSLEKCTDTSTGDHPKHRREKTAETGSKPKQLSKAVKKVSKSQSNNTSIQSDIRAFVASSRSPASKLADESTSPLVRASRRTKLADESTSPLARASRRTKLADESTSPLVRASRRTRMAIDTDSQNSEISSTADTSLSECHTTLSPIVKSRRRVKACAVSSASDTSTVCEAHKTATSSVQIKQKVAQKSTSKANNGAVSSPESSSKGPTIKEHGRPTRNTQIGTKLVFTHTSLSKEQKKSVEDCAKILDAEVVPSYTSKVTHVITSIDADLCCPRTLKYMLAVLEGKWVVSIEWTTFCLESSTRVPENIFEVRGSSIAPKSAASCRSREANEAGLPRLLTGCEFYLSGDFKAPSPPKDQLCQLIQVGGAKVLNRLPKEGSSVGAYHAPKGTLLSKCGTVILSANRDSQKLASITCASPAWLLDCIAQYSLTDPMET